MHAIFTLNLLPPQHTYTMRMMTINDYERDKIEREFQMKISDFIGNACKINFAFLFLFVFTMFWDIKPDNVSESTVIWAAIYNIASFLSFIVARRVDWFSNRREFCMWLGSGSFASLIISFFFHQDVGPVVSGVCCHVDALFILGFVKLIHMHTVRNIPTIIARENTHMHMVDARVLEALDAGMLEALDVEFENDHIC